MIKREFLDVLYSRRPEYAQASAAAEDKLRQAEYLAKLHAEQVAALDRATRKAKAAEIKAEREAFAQAFSKARKDKAGVAARLYALDDLIDAYLRTHQPGSQQ